MASVRCADCFCNAVFYINASGRTCWAVHNEERGAENFVELEMHTYIVEGRLFCTEMACCRFLQGDVTLLCLL